MQRSASCRSWGELSNAYFVAEFGFDTAENEPCQAYQRLLRGPAAGEASGTRGLQDVLHARELQEVQRRRLRQQALGDAGQRWPAVTICKNLREIKLDIFGCFSRNHKFISSSFYYTGSKYFWALNKRFMPSLVQNDPRFAFSP